VHGQQITSVSKMHAYLLAYLIL